MLSFSVVVRELVARIGLVLVCTCSCIISGLRLNKVLGTVILLDVSWLRLLQLGLLDDPFGSRLAGGHGYRGARLL